MVSYNMQTYISEFEYKGQIINLLYTKGNISYIFEHKGERYGGAVKVTGKSIRDIMNATACIVINYLDTREAVEAKDALIS